MVATLIKPIKAKLLPNTITYQQYIGDSGYGDSYNDEVTITRVALQNKVVKQATASGYVTVANALLFVDAYNSKVDGNSITSDLLTVKSKIVYDGRTYTVVDIETLDYEYGQGVHHWEVTLL